MRMANVVIADAMLPSQASQQLFQHNDTKTLDMYKNQPAEAKTAAMAD